jgi:hypothetical protein
MNHKHAVLCLALSGLLGFVPAASTAEKTVQSQWAKTPVQIDGLNQEWQGAPFLGDKSSQAEYAIRNDGENLYIVFVFKSLPALSTLEISGMKVYYSLAGKKSKSAGFHFVKKARTADEFIAALEKSGNVLTDEKKAEIRKQKGFLTYEAEPITPKGGASQPPAGEGEHPTFRDKLSRQISVVEFRIPLARLAEAGATAGPGASLKLGFEWGGATAAIRSAQMARQAEAASQSRGTGGGDLSSQLSGNVEDTAGGGGGFGGRPDPLTKKHSFWIDVRLAAQGD